MQREDSAVLKARAARFRAEAKRPPPPTPKFWTPGMPTDGARKTVFEHKVVKSDTDVVLRKLIERKQRAGEPLTEDQQRALGSIGLSTCNSSSTNSSGQPRKPNTKPKAKPNAKPNAKPAVVQQVAAPNSKPAVAEQTVGAAERKLRKKIRECEALEAVLATGKQLEANQFAKVQGKATLIEELERLQVC